MSREQKALVELYEFFCPNADQYGLRSRTGQWDREAVNALLEKMPIAATNLPDRIHRAWIELEMEEPGSLLEQAFGAGALYL